MSSETARVDVVEAAALWVEATGYNADLSALTAGIRDSSESIRRIVGDLLPRIAALTPQRGDEGLDLFVDLGLELDHVARHAEAASAVARAVRDHLDLSDAPL